MSSATFSSICFDHGYPWMVSKTKKRNTGRPVVKCSLNSKTQKTKKGMRIGVLGASGYTGSEIVRLLANHPYFGITLMIVDRKAGQSIGSIFPHLVTQYLPNMVAIKDADFSDIDAVFCCLPHGTTQEIIKGLPKSLKIVDLSAVSFVSRAFLTYLALIEKAIISFDSWSSIFTRSKLLQIHKSKGREHPS